MRLLRANSLVFGLTAGAVFALAVTLVVTVWEWIENPGGIFRGADGTQWRFVRDTAVSWLLPTFGYAAIAAATGHLVVRVLLRMWRNRSRTPEARDTAR